MTPLVAEIIDVYEGMLEKAKRAGKRTTAERKTWAVEATEALMALRYPSTEGGERQVTTQELSTIRAVRARMAATKEGISQLNAKLVADEQWLADIEADQHQTHEGDIREMLALLTHAYEALSAIQRAGFPLEETYPATALEAYDHLGEYLWPDSGVTPQERWGLVD